VGGGETVTEARAETADETVPEAARKAVLKTMEPVHDDDGRCQTKIPRRAYPVRKKLGIGIIDRIRVFVGVR